MASPSPVATRPSPSTLGELVRRTQRALQGAGIAEPRREAVRLIAARVGVPPAAVVIEDDRSIEPSTVARVDEGVSRRVRGEPLAYIAGEAGFRTLELAVDRRVLIPRPETEGLVELAMSRWPSGVVADIGVGSGAIALSLRAEGRYRQVLGVDLSPDALAVARGNRDRHRLEVELVRGDLSTGFRSATLDLLVSNPPYIAAGEAVELDRSVREFEPQVALFGGEEGVELSERLLRDALRVVRSGGGIAIELAAERADRTALVARALGWIDVTVEDDLFGRPRYLAARRP